MLFLVDEKIDLIMAKLNISPSGENLSERQVTKFLLKYLISVTFVAEYL